MGPKSAATVSPAFTATGTTQVPVVTTSPARRPVPRRDSSLAIQVRATRGSPSTFAPLPVWVSFTAGPDADLLRPAEVRAGAQEAVRLGATAVLVNCVPATRTLPYPRALADLGVPFGAYANAGAADEALGWAGHHDDPDAAERYADLAEGWVAAGASLLGSCCGTGPRTIRALHARFADPVPSLGAVT